MHLAESSPLTAGLERQGWSVSPQGEAEYWSSSSCSTPETPPLKPLGMAQPPTAVCPPQTPRGPSNQGAAGLAPKRLGSWRFCAPAQASRNTAGQAAPARTEEAKHKQSSRADLRALVSIVRGPGQRQLHALFSPEPLRGLIVKHSKAEVRPLMTGWEKPSTEPLVSGSPVRKCWAHRF